MELLLVGRLRLGQALGLVDPGQRPVGPELPLEVEPDALDAFPGARLIDPVLLVDARERLGLGQSRIRSRTLPPDIRARYSGTFRSTNTFARSARAAIGQTRFDALLLLAAFCCTLTIGSVKRCARTWPVLAAADRTMATGAVRSHGLQPAEQFPFLDEQPFGRFRIETVEVAEDDQQIGRSAVPLQHAACSVEQLVDPAQRQRCSAPARGGWSAAARRCPAPST